MLSGILNIADRKQIFEVEIWNVEVGMRKSEKGKVHRALCIAQKQRAEDFEAGIRKAEVGRLKTDDTGF